MIIHYNIPTSILLQFKLETNLSKQTKILKKLKEITKFFNYTQKFKHIVYTLDSQ